MHMQKANLMAGPQSLRQKKLVSVCASADDLASAVSKLSRHVWPCSDRSQSSRSCMIEKHSRCGGKHCDDDEEEEEEEK